MVLDKRVGSVGYENSLESVSLETKRTETINAPLKYVSLSSKLSAVQHSVPSILCSADMFTRNLVQTDPYRKSDWIGLLFTRDPSETGPKRIQTDPKLELLSCRSSLGSVWIRSRLILNSPVWTQDKRFGPVRNLSGPVLCNVRHVKPF